MLNKLIILSESFVLMVKFNNEIGIKSTFRSIQIHFLCHCQLWQVLVFVYYTSEMCTAFGVLKDVNISNQYKRQIMIYRKINTPLQYTF